MKTSKPKIATFLTPLSLNAFVRSEPSEFLEEPYLAKTRLQRLSIGEDFAINVGFILIQYQSINCSRQAHGKTY